ncbi:hypothetical protein ColTof3_03534 [Colletotrichum tofieldiae]|nr:hypothetical protein ColTof3_03534 [Colletotrichum tofieldiae]
MQHESSLAAKVGIRRPELRPAAGNQPVANVFPQRTLTRTSPIGPASAETRHVIGPILRRSSGPAPAENFYVIGPSTSGSKAQR